MFLKNTLEVLNQVIVLFILMGAGFAAGKFRWIDSSGAKQLSTLLFKVVTSCVIINAFLRVEFSVSKLSQMGIAFACCIVSSAVGAIISRLVFRRKNDPNISILRFGTTFSNCGFMSLPLADMILGSEGVFVVSVFVAAFHMLIWTYGVSLFGGKNMDLKKVFLNPGTIGVLIGLPLFLLKIKLPSVISMPLSSLAALNTPVAMIIIGFYLSNIKLKRNDDEGSILLSSAIRLIICPIFMFGLLYTVGIRGQLLTACMIPVCAPCAGNTSIMAVVFEKDGVFASRLVGICTLFSIITMPLLLAFSMAV